MSFDLSQLPPALRQGASVVETAARCNAAAEAGRFEEGQISGPFGPQFVGYGETPKVPLCRYVAEWAALLFLGSMLMMAVR